jgi:hypothetical protein
MKKGIATSRIYFKTTEKFKEFCAEHNVHPSVVETSLGECIGARVYLENEVIIAIFCSAEFENAPYKEQGE